MLPTIRYTKIFFVKKFLGVEIKKKDPCNDDRLQNPTEADACTLQ
jgi:hypothetical protein